MADPRAIQDLFELVQRLALLLRQTPRLDGVLPGGERSIVELLVNQGPCTVPQLARLRASSRQNVQIIVNRLHAHGSVELLKNPAHRRSPLVGATQKGIAGLRRSTRHQSESIGRTLSIPEAEALAAAAVLRRLQTALASQSLQPTALPTEPQPQRKSVSRNIRAPKAGSDFVVATQYEPPLQEHELPVSLL